MRNTLCRHVAFLAALALSGSGTAISSEPIHINVHPAVVLGSIHRAVLGVNSDTRYDGAAALAAASRVLSTIGASGSRWPGGTHADMFNWQDAAPSQMRPYCNSRIRQVSADGDFDTYVNSLAIPDGLNPEITVNYGTSGWPECTQGGDPMLAAAWVKYANITKGYNIKWWEVGNEVYERGEPDKHPNPHSAESYAQFEPPFYSAMKAVDPSILVGIPVTAGAHGVPNWDSQVLAGAKFDYVVFHYYPEFYPHISDAGLLAAPTQGPFEVAKLMANIRSQLASAGKCTSPCTGFPISISEWNSVSHNPTPQTLTIVEGLFAAETLGEFFNAGVSRAEFFVDQGCQDNSPGASGYNADPAAPVYGWQHGTGALGLSVFAGVPDPLLCPHASFSAPPGTIFPSGRAIQLYAQSGFASEGSSSVLIDNPTPALRTYASYNAAQHRYVVCLINLDENNDKTVRLTVDGIPGGPGYKMLQYSKKIYDETRDNGPWNGPISKSGDSWKSPVFVTLPPWSITTYTLMANAEK